MSSIKETLRNILGNRWFKFGFWSIIYILICVVWTGNLWMLLGLLLIFEIFITKFFSRFVWYRYRVLKHKNTTFRVVMEWVEAIVFAVVVTTLIKQFIFGMYVIPTSSMESTLLVGDYLYVSKLRYGPQVPNTPLSFPLVHNTMPFSSTKKSYSESVKWDYHRLKGLSDVERGDVVVFNFPAGDTVVLGRQNETYYDILRDYQQQYGEEEGRRALFSDYTIIYHPVDKRENYVKRCVGLPGDTVVLADAKLRVNGEALGDIPTLQQNYLVYTDGNPISNRVLQEMGLSQEDIYYDSNNKIYYMPLTAENVKRVEGLNNVIRMGLMENNRPSAYTFPHDERYPWNGDNYGPLWIPSKGATVQLTTENLPLYRTIIENYELHRVEVRGDKVYIDDKPVTKYTFEMDYFFMVGDNRDNSADSRYWGFVPEDHIVGKASFIWMSTDKHKGRFPFNIRWKRLFTKIK